MCVEIRQAFRRSVPERLVVLAIFLPWPKNFSYDGLASFPMRRPVSNGTADTIGGLGISQLTRPITSTGLSNLQPLGIHESFSLYCKHHRRHERWEKLSHCLPRNYYMDRGCRI